MKVGASIFKAYDIRRVVDRTLTEDAVRAVGRVLGTMAHDAGVMRFCVGRDVRLTGERLQNALVEGIASTGIDVLDVGTVPTPVVYYATKHFDCGTGVAVTGSHNPPEYNGLKMMVAGVTLFADEIQGICERIEREDWCVAEKPGRIEHDVEVVPLYGDVDGHFPNHHPAPFKPEDLEALIDKVKEVGADYGFALDGDADRLGVVTNAGSHLPGPPHEAFCGRHSLQASGRSDRLRRQVLAQPCRLGPRKGRRPLHQSDRPFARKGQVARDRYALCRQRSGHLFFNDERWTGFDDGLYSAVRQLEILSRSESLSPILQELPNAVNTPEIQIPTEEDGNKAFIAAFQKECRFPDADSVITIDGVRVEWKDRYALARASNTTPVVVVRYVGDTKESLERIWQCFTAEMLRVDSALKIQ